MHTQVTLITFHPISHVNTNLTIGHDTKVGDLCVCGEGEGNDGEGRAEAKACQILFTRTRCRRRPSITLSS